MSQDNSDTLRLGLPKGRMQEAVMRLLGDAGIRVTPSARGYRAHGFAACVRSEDPQATEHHRDARAR